MGAQEKSGDGQCQLTFTSDRKHFQKQPKQGRCSRSAAFSTTTTVCWTICFALMFSVDTSLSYRLEEDDDISTNDLLPPLPSTYSAAESSNHHSKNIKIFYQSGVSSFS